MDRMKTLLSYALVIIIFWIFSNIAMDLLIKNSYKSVDKSKIEIASTNNGFQVNVDRANSNKAQAYFTGKVKNNSKTKIEKQYVKVDSYYKGKLMQEKYLAFENMQPGEERKFKLLYEVGNIDEYKVSYVDEIPVNDTIIDRAIVATVDFINKALNKVGNANIGNIDVAGGVKGVVNKFEPVHVEGEDWQLMMAVLLVIWALPTGFFF